MCVFISFQTIAATYFALLKKIDVGFFVLKKSEAVIFETLSERVSVLNVCLCHACVFCFPGTEGRRWRSEDIRSGWAGGQRLIPQSSGDRYAFTVFPVCVLISFQTIAVAHFAL